MKIFLTCPRECVLRFSLGTWPGLFFRPFAGFGTRGQIMVSFPKNSVFARIDCAACAGMISCACLSPLLFLFFLKFVYLGALLSFACFGVSRARGRKAAKWLRPKFFFSRVAGFFPL